MNILAAILLVVAASTCGAMGRIIVHVGSTDQAGLLTYPSLNSAMNHVRRARLQAPPGHREEATVYVHAGVHQLTDTVELASDTSVELFPPDAAAGREAMLHGATVIRPSEWQPSATLKNVYVARLKRGVATQTGAALQLHFADGRRALPARTPNAHPADPSRGLGHGSTLLWEAPLQPCSSTICPAIDSLGFVYANSDIRPTLHNLNDIRLLVFQAWVGEWHRIQSVHESNKVNLNESNAIFIRNVPSLHRLFF